MSLLTPTQYGQSEYNLYGYNITAVPQTGYVDLSDVLTLADAISGNPIEDLLEIIRINEWIDVSLIKANIWNTPTGPSATWTTPDSGLSEQWTNTNAPHQIP